MTFHVLIGHFKGKNVDPEKGLPIAQRSVHQDVDLFNGAVGHGKTTDGDAAAVDHQSTPTAAVKTIIGIGIAEIEGKVVVAVRIHLTRADKIESLRCTAVTGPDFGSHSFAAIGADGIDLEKPEAVFLFEPHFQSLFGLVDTQVYGCSP